ncbi:MAG: hexapeptide transferase [Armatimonadota bacterium]|nr:MAG: hexapeptide transferase [Armatimonadota bacterium]
MPDREPIAIIGAGGHARVVIGTLQAAGLSAGAVFDDNPSTWDAEILGVPVLGAVSRLTEEGYNRAVIAIGDNATRRRLSEQLRGIEWVKVIHPHTWIHPSVQIGEGTVILAGVVIQPEARVGNHAILNTGATIDHECIIHDYAHVAPGVHLAGRVEVGEGAFIGIGSSVIQCCKVGAWAVIGAGAAVVRDIPDGVTAVGVPARVLQTGRG